MHNNPGRCHARKRSTDTLNSFTSDQSLQLVDPVAQVGSEARDLLPQSRQTTSTDLVEPAFRDHEGALPIIFAIEHHKDAAGVDPPEGLPWILRTA
jgi:hypothetical protein